jgi:molybdopterin molybdotransferase
MTMHQEGLLPFSEALSRLLASAKPVGAERVPLEEADGRVLAEPIFAPFPMPAFDHSSMDGYALASADLRGGGPWELPVAGESAAGGELPVLTPGTSCRIFTGAQLPEGADAVVKQEDVERRGDSIVLRDPVKAGAYVRHKGTDLREGAPALAAGSRLTPGKLALAAALDRPLLLLARRPVVSVLCTGDELRAPGEPGRAGTVAESNGTFVAATARAAGAITRVLPYVRDDETEAARAVADALRGSDLVVTIGGVSVGDRDVMRPALAAGGVELDFWRVALKPGKPLAVGRAGLVHVLGLPGNPASASLTFLLFGVPLLRALQGDAAPLPARQRARVLGGYRRESGREEFVRAHLSVRSLPAPEGATEIAELCAELLPNQASGAVTSFAEADGLVVVPAAHGSVTDGERLEAIRIVEI